MPRPAPSVSQKSAFLCRLGAGPLGQPTNERHRGRLRGGGLERLSLASNHHNGNPYILISSFLFGVWLFSWEATPTPRKLSRGKDDLEYLNLYVSGYALALEPAAVLGLVAGPFYTSQQLRATSDDLQTAQLDLAFSAMQTVGDQLAIRQVLFAQASQQLSQAGNSRAQIEGLYILAGTGRSALSTASTCAFLLKRSIWGGT